MYTYFHELLQGYARVLHYYSKMSTVNVAPMFHKQDDLL